MWFKKAFAISERAPNEYYIVTNPIEFHEMKFTGMIPNGTRIDQKLPRSDAFIGGKVIISANIPPDFIHDGQLQQDIYATTTLKIGEVQSATELYNRFLHLNNEFDRNLDEFRKASLSQKYVVSRTDDPQLCIIEGDENTAVIKRLCKMSDLLTKIADARNQVQEEKSVKTGRAYEHYDLRKLDNLATYIDNKSVPLDIAKISWFLDRSKIEPQFTEKTSWLKCYTSLNPIASDTYDRMKKFTELKWVQHIIGPVFMQESGEKHRI